MSKRYRKVLYSASIMLFFYALFDGLLSYILPIKITGLGYSKTQMGMIIGLSNIFGATFDFLLAKFITNTSYRRLFLVAYILACIYPILMWSSNSLPYFVLAMAVWGLYGDLNQYATFDLVSRRAKSKEHCSSFGIIGVFRSLGYLLAPIIAGLVAVEVITFFPFSLSISSILMALFFYILLINFSPKKDSSQFDHKAKYRHLNFFHEFQLLSKVGRVILPVLIFNVSIYIYDSVFWTIGPIFSQTFANFPDFGGLFMSAYTLPVLFVNWLVNPMILHFGKKRTAFVAFLMGSTVLLPIFLINNPVIIIGLVFVSSVLSSIAWPAIFGAYADYIAESSSYEIEIESLSDFTYNLGYIIGPIMGGFLADSIGVKNVFSVLATYSILITLGLLFLTPKHIKVLIHRK